jgi:hypothetical protein
MSGLRIATITGVSRVADTEKGVTVMTARNLLTTTILAGARRLGARRRDPSRGRCGLPVREQSSTKRGKHSLQPSDKRLYGTGRHQYDERHR